MHAKAFTCWCVVDTMSIPGYTIPPAVTSFMDLRVTLSRIKVFVNWLPLFFRRSNET